MKMQALPIVLAIATLCGATPVSGQGVARTDASLVAQRQAAKIVDAFHAALARGDMAGAAALLASDALIYERGGVERGKAEYASHHLPADAAFAKAVRRSVTRRSGRAEGELAWVATEARTTGTYKGKAVDSIGTETMVLRRNGGTWRIAHVHWSSADAK